MKLSHGEILRFCVGDVSNEEVSPSHSGSSFLSPRTVELEGPFLKRLLDREVRRSTLTTLGALTLPCKIVISDSSLMSLRLTIVFGSEVKRRTV